MINWGSHNNNNMLYMAYDSFFIDYLTPKMAELGIDIKNNFHDTSPLMNSDSHIYYLENDCENSDHF